MSLPPHYSQDQRGDLQDRRPKKKHFRSPSQSQQQQDSCGTINTHSKAVKNATTTTRTRLTAEELEYLKGKIRRIPKEDAEALCSTFVEITKWNSKESNKNPWETSMEVYQHLSAAIQIDGLASTFSSIDTDKERAAKIDAQQHILTKLKEDLALIEAEYAQIEQRWETAKQEKRRDPYAKFKMEYVSTKIQQQKNAVAKQIILIRRLKFEAAERKSEEAAKIEKIERDFATFNLGMFVLRWIFNEKTKFLQDWDYFRSLFFTTVKLKSLIHR
jgi:hypothetical protein